MYVMNQLDPNRCKLDGLSERDDVTRAEIMLNNSFALGCDEVVGPNDIVKGNEKVNIIFVAELFNTKHGLDDTDIVIEEDSREERAFRQWINSLGIDGVFVHSLYHDLKDGTILCKVIHRINDKVVEWNRLEKNPDIIFKRTINCQVAMDAARKLGVQMLGIGAHDIATGHKQFILAIVWQLVRLHALQLIGSKSEQDLLDWVSQTEHVTAFNDRKFEDGRLLIRLCELVDPTVVNWSFVKEGKSQEDKELNAKYAISLARKLGAVIFLVWDDIPNLNKKMILIFVCSLYDLKHKLSD